MHPTARVFLLSYAIASLQQPIPLSASGPATEAPKNSRCAVTPSRPDSLSTDAGCSVDSAKDSAKRDLPDAPMSTSAKTAVASGALGVVRTTISVTGLSVGLDTTEGFETKVSEKEIETSAGTFGDPSRFMQILPGVVSDNDQYNDFIIRGGNPDENLFVVDNIEVPSINQLALSDTTGGFVSMIDNAAIQRMTVHTDAYDSKYDQRLSSVIEFSTRPENRETTHSEFEVGIAGAGGSATRPWGHDGSVFVSGRRSVLNLLTNDIGMNGVPIYNNILVRGDKRVDEKDDLWGLSLTGIDSINIHPSPTDSWETNPYDIRYQGWRNTTGLNWQHLYSPRAFGVLSFSNSQQSQNVVENAQLLNETTVYSENTSDGITVLKYDSSVEPRPWLMLSAGARAAVDRLNYIVDQPLGLENPYSSDPAPQNMMSLNRRFSAFSSGLYAEASVLLPHQIKIVAGERLSQWSMTGSSLWSPKVLFMSPLLGRMLHVGYAEYGQLPPNLYLLSYSNQQTLSPIRSRQLTAGIDLLTMTKIKLSVDGYRKRYLDYPVALNYPQLSLANVADTFGQAFLIFPMTNHGKGIADGAELSLHYNPSSRLSLGSSVTYSRSWYSGLDGVLRRGNYDLPLVANVSGNVYLSRHSIVSFRYSGTSGRPYTPDDIGLSVAQERDVYDLSKINAARSSAYKRLDFRLEHVQSISRGVLTWHIGLENALGTSNFYANQWRPRAGTAGVLAQDQMPRFPDGGVKFSY
jgi:hypothetical protein